MATASVILHTFLHHLWKTASKSDKFFGGYSWLKTILWEMRVNHKRLLAHLFFEVLDIFTYFASERWGILPMHIRSSIHVFLSSLHGKT